MGLEGRNVVLLPNGVRLLWFGDGCDGVAIPSFVERWWLGYGSWLCCLGACCSFSVSRRVGYGSDDRSDPIRIGGVLFSREAQDRAPRERLRRGCFALRAIEFRRSAPNARPARIIKGGRPFGTRSDRLRRPSRGTDLLRARSFLFLRKNYERL